MLPVAELPPRLIIDWAARCNLACPMCLVWGSDDNQAVSSVKGIMPVEAGRALLDEIASATPIVQPSMWGEPLLIPEFWERVHDMHVRDITVALNTNGLALDGKTCSRIVDEQINAVFVSIDAVSRSTLKAMRGIDKLEKIEAGVFRLLAERAKACSEYPRIGVSFTLQDGNRHEEKAFIARWSHLVDCVRIGAVFADGTFPDAKPIGERKPCPALYSTMAVHNNGQVSVCCLDSFRETDMGNVFTDGGVKAVWHGAKMTAARQAHENNDFSSLPFCQSCTGWSQHQFEEFEQDNMLVRKSPIYTYYNRLDRMANWSAQRQATPSFRAH